MLSAELLTATAAKLPAGAHLSGKRGVEAIVQRSRWGATTH